MSASRIVTHIPCVSCPLRSKTLFRKRTADELDLIQGIKAGELVAEPGMTVLLEGTRSAHFFTVQEGWAFRYKSFDDGRRQILSFALPGDVLSIQGAVNSELRYSVEALTLLRLCFFPRELLWAKKPGQSSIAYDLIEVSAWAEEAADHHLQSLGGRTAAERIAHLILHLADRTRTLEMAHGQIIDMPLTQSHIADALGLSLVHTNKTLRSMERSSLIKWSAGRVEICDEPSMHRLARFEAPTCAERPFI